jgi:hypothetical protein
MAVKQRGRPATLSATDKDLLLEAIEGGLSNARACQSLHIEPSTFYLTLSREPEFMERYQAAKAVAVEAVVDEAEEAAHEARRAESGHQVAGAKVFADFKKWQAARLAPQRWGDKSTVQLTTQLDSSDQEMAKRIAFLEALNGNGPGDDAEPDDDGGDLV